MTTTSRQQRKPASNGLLPQLWGVGGVLLLLGRGVWRLTHIAVAELWGRELSLTEVALLLSWGAIAAYAEGYRAFQRGFAPRVAARALELRRPLHVALAPLFVMALIHATRRRLITSWVALVLIVGLVVAVQNTPQPYRALIDAGVALALAWGMVATVLWWLKARRGDPMPVSADLPR
jgi:hypothetical protein